MDYNDVKNSLLSCDDIDGLDETSRALLLWHATEEKLKEGTVIYAEDTALDDTFGVLLRGKLAVEKAGKLLGEISGNQVFGEMAYFTRLHSRTATVKAGSDGAAILRVKLSPQELSSPRFQQLKNVLGLEAWDRFVSSSQQIS